MYKYLILFILVSMHFNIRSQITFINTSFEDIPGQISVPPKNWSNCEGNSTPDIQPNAWQVTTLPSDGNSYVGFVVREDGTNEELSQQLSTPLSKDTCYVFNIDLAYSTIYSSTNYGNPGRIRCWAGFDFCDKAELLWTSPLIDHTDWETYTVKFSPNANYTHFLFESGHENIGGPFYFGNVLLDNISNINVVHSSFLEINGGDNICEYNDSSLITITPLNSGAFTFSVLKDLLPFNSYDSVNQFPIQFYVNQAGDYTLSATQECLVLRGNALIDYHPQPSPNIFPLDPVCAFSTQNFTVSGLNGSTFNWTSFNDASNTIIDNSALITFSDETQPVTIKVVETSSEGCTDSLNVEVGVLPLPKATIYGDTALCPTSGNQATIGIQVEGTPPFIVTYNSSINGPNTVTSNNLLYNVSSIQEETFTLLNVSDQFGCLANNLMGSATVSHFTIIDTSNLTIDCLNDNQFQLSFDIKGDTTGLVYSGNTGTLFSNSWTSNPIANGEYQIIVNDPNNCNPIKISGRKRCDCPVNLDLILDQEICIGDSVQLIASGGSTYTWQDPTGTLSDITSDSPWATPSTTSSYVVQIQDSLGCVWFDAVKIEIKESPNISLSSSAIKIFTGTKVVITANTNVETFTWSSSNSSDDLTGETSPEINVSPIVKTTYEFKGDLKGCPISDTITILVVHPLVIPYFFSPNGDGENDELLVNGLENYDRYTLSIYNRWGNLIREYDNNFTNWDGKSNVNIALPDGTYYYVLEAFVLEEKRTLSGHITISR